MKIGTLEKRSGLTTHTIRYYERIGLLPMAPRDQSGHRDYDETTLAWIEFLGHLKATGMPIKDMLVYAQMRMQGDESGQSRHDLLVQHRTTVRAHIAKLQACLTVLDGKISNYAKTISKSEMKHHAASN
ncbi:MAG: MerR family transcriptional regulator [Alphaproteobacteria bacterium]|nr:MerR family transcriptional regulator [Alphaproteobacteria bacterium]